MPKNLTDAALMARVAAGDSRAFDEIYRRHRHSALLVARRLGARKDLGEEVVQEAFVALWRGAGQYRHERGSVASWLGTIVRNRLTDAWRRTSARPVEVHMTGSGELESATSGDLAIADRLELRSRVAALPADQREAVALAYFGGLTHRQIAAVSEAPLGTVKGRLRLGLEKLREPLVGSEAA
jgi:RNA polymerase sigma-70 factor (ECF subfamily)